MTEARLFDGRTALDRVVELTAVDGALVLSDPGGEAETIDPAELSRLDSGADEQRFARQDHDGWRLIVREPVDASILALLPGRHWLDPSLRRWPMVLAIGATALVTAALVTLVAAPYAVARRLPQSWEDRLGEAYDIPADYATCDDAKAQQALDAMVDRLDPSARVDGIRIRLLDVDEANAAALPGRQVVIFRGLFDMADNEDAIAAIIAHELAHVRRRHVSAAIIRQLGIGTVVTLAGGGTIAGTGGDLLSLRYTRQAEAEADDDAIAMLRRAQIDPRPTGDLFRKFQSQDLIKGGTWLNSHPASGERARKFDGSWIRDKHYQPALNKALFKELTSACGEAGFKKAE